MQTMPHGFYKNLLDNLHDGVYFIDIDGYITYWNNGAERLTGYCANDVIGSRCSDGLLMHVTEDGDCLCGNKCPLGATMRDGKSRKTEVYLHHKDGHQIPVSVRSSPIYDDTGKILGAVEIFSDNTSKLAALTRVDKLITENLTDPLTKVGNRRFTDITLHSRFDEVLRYGWDFGILFIDIDHFKMINDTYGHTVGDDVLCMVAKTLQNCIRSFDFIGRYGGEEFIILLPNVNLDTLNLIARRCRNLVQSSSIERDNTRIRVSISIGGTLSRENDTPQTIINRADSLMYKSKRSGRNCITLDKVEACRYLPANET
ncbi:sensor domain-containing diguanylate cyclase [Desulfovibrio inopinatus]|uniref:sensor domain-containing diguanylate cyclase n=1 Tax=Desulfovibrio inopinatus TaxID=102109 RepID=UPI0004054133|nr:sensor domain-containing diguanylate cyclase [Desulfovibrio inopinatus]